MANKSNREFSRPLINLTIKNLLDVSTPLGLPVVGLELYVRTTKRLKLYCPHTNERKIATWCLVQLKRGRKIFIDISKSLEPIDKNLHLIKVPYKDKLALRKQKKSLLDGDFRRGNFEFISGDKIAHYHLVKNSEAKDIEQLQKAICKKQGVRSIRKLKSIELPNEFFYEYLQQNPSEWDFDSEANIVVRKLCHTSNSRCSATALAQSLGLDFIESPQAIALDNENTLPIEKREELLLPGGILSDMKILGHGSLEATLPAVVCAFSPMIGEFYEVKVPHDDYLDINQNHFEKVNLSCCLVGSEQSGIIEAIELAKKVLAPLNAQAAELNSEHEKDHDINDFAYRTKISMHKNELKRHITTGLDDVHGEKCITKKLRKAYENEPTLNIHTPILLTNDLQSVLDACAATTKGVLHIPTNAKRLFNELASAEDQGKRFTNLLLGGDKIASSIYEYEVSNRPAIFSSLCALTPNEFDAIQVQIEQELSSYSPPINNYDLYVDVSEINTAKDKSAIYHEEGFIKLQQFCFELTKILKNRSNSMPIMLSLDPSLLEEYNDFLFDQGKYLKSIEDQHWLYKQTKKLNHVILKVATIYEIFQAYDDDERKFDEVECISKRSFNLARIFVERLSTHLHKIDNRTNIDIANAKRLASKLRLLDKPFTARTIYKDKGWGGFKNNADKTHRALKVLEKFHYIYVHEARKKGSDEHIVWKRSPKLEK